MKATLPATGIRGNQSVNFTRSSKYADVCHLADPPKGAADFVRAARAAGAAADSIARNQWPASGSEPFKGGTFDPGEYHQDFYCVGDNGKQESERATLRLTVLAWKDSDKDGMPDDWERKHGFDPKNARDAKLDPDGDDNLTEFLQNTNPQVHEVAQLLNFSLAEDTIKDNEVAEFHWKSRYASSCHLTNDPAGKDLGKAGPKTSEVGDFAVGVWEIGMYCKGPGGESDERTVTLTVEVSAETDTDGDGMPDLWEEEHGFDPKNPSDADEDADGDGHSNKDEYDAETDPNDPDDRPPTDPGGPAPKGFNADYKLFTVTTEIPNPEGEEWVPIEHLLVKNTNRASRAEIDDFAMREEYGYGDFRITSLNADWLKQWRGNTDPPLGKDPVIGDYNHDGWDDLAVVELDDTKFPGGERIVFARPDASNYVPTRAAVLDADARDFFGSLARWIGDTAEFEDEFDIEITDDGRDDGASIQGGAANAKPSLSLKLENDELLELDAKYEDPNIQPPSSALPDACFERMTFCQFVYIPEGTKSVILELGRNNFPGTLTVSKQAEDELFRAFDGGTTAVYWFVESFVKGWFLGKFSLVLNTGGVVPPGLRDAAVIWETILRPLGNSGTIVLGTPEAAKIAEILEDYLGVEVFGGVLEDILIQNLPPMVEHGDLERVDILGEILIILEEVYGKLEPAEQNVTDPNPTPSNIDCSGNNCVPCEERECQPMLCDNGQCLILSCAEVVNPKPSENCISDIHIAEICYNGDHFPEWSNDKRYKKFCGSWVLPIVPMCSIKVELLPDKEEHTINPSSLAMPEIEAKITVSFLNFGEFEPPDEVDVAWKATIAHEAPSNNCYQREPIPVRTEIEDEVWVEQLAYSVHDEVTLPVVAVSGTGTARAVTTVTPDLTRAFGLDLRVMGDDYIFTAQCRDPDRDSLSHVSASTKATTVVVGENPSTQSIGLQLEYAALRERNRDKKPKGDYSDTYYSRMVEDGSSPAGALGGTIDGAHVHEPVPSILKRIACVESFGGNQFYPPGFSGDVQGMPLYNDPGGDVGIMQACWDRRPQHMWDWVENVNRGALLFRDGLQSVAYEYLVNQVKPILGYQDIDDPDLTTEQRLEIRAEMRKYIREETIHRYKTRFGPDGRNDTFTGYWRYVSGRALSDVDLEDGKKTGYVGKVNTVSCPLVGSSGPVPMP